MALDVDEIVRQVIARLKAEGGAAAPTATAGELQITDRVVTVANVRDRLAGIRQVVVRRGAVITPAAKDLLKEKNIAIAWQAGTTNNPARVGGQSLVVGVAETKYCPAKLCGQLRKSGVAVEQLARTGWVQVTTELCDHVAKSGKAGVLFTTVTAPAVCLANRVRGVRAVTAETRAGIETSIRAAGANLLVVNPTGRGAWELTKIIELFTHGAPWAPPAGL